MTLGNFSDGDNSVVLSTTSNENAHVRIIRNKTTC